MPNKLSDVKMRKTLTEHKAVIAVLEKIAQEKNVTIMELMREGIRNEIRKNARNNNARKEILNVFKNFEPALNEDLCSPAELAKFKREQRNFDNLMLDLNLETPDHIEKNNSVVSPSAEIKVLELEKQHVE